MINWNYNPNEYNERSFAPIPEGDHKVTIKNVTERIFNSGKEGFEITLTYLNKHDIITIKATHF